MQELLLIIILSLWVVFWSFTWVYDQTRMGKRDFRNILLAGAGCLVLVLYFFLKWTMINHTIHCHHCYESFDIEIDTHDVSDQIVWDCEICCNPNLISYKFKNYDKTLEIKSEMVTTRVSGIVCLYNIYNQHLCIH